MKNNKLYFFFVTQKSNIALICILGMILGFLCGRAILSISMLLFFINGIWNVAPKEWLKLKWTMWGLIWVGVYVISYFWSQDIPYWQERTQVKLPFGMLPVAFGLLPIFKQKQLKWITLGLNVLLIGACAYSLSFYITDKEKILNGYYFSRVLPTPAYRDHIRFSIFVAWGILWNCFMFRRLGSKMQRGLLLSCIIFFCIYLHILAVRSGLLFLYSFIFSYVIYLFFKGKAKSGLIIIASFCLGLVAAYHLVPSFKTKLYYVIYSFKEYENGNISADYSDIGRIISYDLALKIIKEHPIIGVGAGDIREEMKKKYQIYSPNTKPEQRIVPHNQLMEISLAGGLITLVSFLIWLFYPIYGLKRSREGFYIFATWFALFLSMMVEPMLEVQFGVFVFLFCLLMVQKACETEQTSPEALQPNYYPDPK